MINNICEFNDKLLDFLVERGGSFPNKDFKCSDCPGWCGEYCVIQEMWHGIKGFGCEIDREHLRVILHTNNHDDTSLG